MTGDEIVEFEAGDLLFVSKILSLIYMFVVYEKIFGRNRFWFWLDLLIFSFKNSDSVIVFS